MHGGDWVAEVLQAHGVRFVFTLTGGHISPILVACQQRGIRVVDTRHEANAVFAAEAMSRLSGVTGVAVVTAGPGVTNTLTAIQSAQMAQTPLVLLGGAAATVLQGRGALQDINQLSLFRTTTKWSRSVRQVRQIVPALVEAFYQAQSGVPGPVFLELPIDLLYQQPLVRQWYGIRAGGRGLGNWLVQRYLRFHLARLFAGASTRPTTITPKAPNLPRPGSSQVARVAHKLRQAERPLLLVGSQALLDVANSAALAAAVDQLGIPVYLSGMARGLLGRDHPLHMRHQRRSALREADFVLLAGVPCDFRLDYGRHIRRSACYVSVNRSRRDLTRNRRPQIGVLGDPGEFLRRLGSELAGHSGWPAWQATLRQRDAARNLEIAGQALAPTGKINPLHLCQEVDATLGPETILVVDGGDFVATASYIVRPAGPLSWLDPGPFGTLGVGAGFALGAKLARPGAEVWLLYGDGAAGFSLAEFDTFVRHQVPVIALVGNDASWSQIARDQVTFLHDDVGTVLAHTNYHQVAAGFGALGLALNDPEFIPETLARAREAAAGGQPVLINAIIGKSDFRQGSTSV